MHLGFGFLLKISSTDLRGSPLKISSTGFERLPIKDK